jgi:hypothetical protein
MATDTTTATDEPTLCQSCSECNDGECALVTQGKLPRYWLDRGGVVTLTDGTPSFCQLYCEAAR